MRLLALHIILQRLIKIGTLHVIDYQGQKRTYRGSTPLIETTARFHTPRIITQLLINPDLAIGEGYMNGEITVEDGSIYDLLYLLSTNLRHNSVTLPQKIHAFWQRKIRTWMRNISPTAAKANVAHHYDLSPRLYDLFLDDDRQYSCAYYRKLDNDLNTAQLDKKRHLAAKLLLEPGQTVLDIGCGWGGLALYLAQQQQVNVIGLTLSEEQFSFANERARKAGLEDRVQFLLQDYREINGKFDRIVSVGMFEHVGLAHYKEFFKQVHNLLADDGVALLHSIGLEFDIGTRSPWIQKYIFPNCYLPSLSEVIPIIEQQLFHVTDIELLHHHYANTLQAWRERFLENKHALPAHLDDNFVRMWEFYLAGCQASFENLGLMNFQIQMMKNKNLIPLTRDYIYEYEHGHPHQS